MKKLLKIKRRISKFNSWNQIVYYLLDNGFSVHDMFSHVLINEKEKIVVKNPYVFKFPPEGNKDKNFTPYFKIPLGKNPPSKDTTQWVVVQPLVRTPSFNDEGFYKNEQYLKLKKCYEKDYDVYVGNVGYYRNKLVLHDW